MNSENAEVYYEGGQTPVQMTALTDDGDHISFNSSGSLWSKKSGFEADVKPNGLANGGAVSAAASGTNNLVDVAALTCYLAGVLTSVNAAADSAITRATAPATHKTSSVTITAAGAVAIVAGTDGTAFSETRAAAGGPPLIPVGSIEVAQVRLSSNTAAAIAAAEIFDTIGTHTERWDYPTWEEKEVRTDIRVLGVAGIDFASALPLSHTGAVPKAVYASWNEPDFVKVPESVDFVPPETSHSTSSKQIYSKTKASVSSSIGQGSFTALLKDGISDNILGEKNETLWFKFVQDSNKTPYIICNGKLGISRTFPAGDDTQAACTVSPEEAAVEVIS
ncbi:MAG: hypothetical protein P1P81_04425 [Desulfobulbales bacterium]|nr:hypothetical protein [Desulfobulbales bacterium]